MHGETTKSDTVYCIPAVVTLNNH